ncbi:hypothetical protein HK105_201828 [Polyrhizophydium stewartii]|uniref:RWD domain-containing protein n=1 Tax=Polyrhizophydium stewartii TaxID=2732419 RepID=A0ABR4NFX4_9FUNG
MSPSGRDVVLAAKRGLYVVDLEHPFGQPRFFQHLTKWDVADVQWNPHASRSNWIASTSNQKALIWNLELGVAAAGTVPQASNKHVEFVLSKHDRAVSDMHWSPFHPESIATCSYDAFVHLWDLRMGADKPSNSFSSWTAGATQVKYNRINERILASAHDTDVRIWDVRKGSQPITVLTAHMSKIYGIDWSRRHENEIITCSQDMLVKFWNITQPRLCQSTITTTAPVWRSRFTPFGDAVVTMPHRRDNNLYLWSCDDKTTPIYTFSGHTDSPIEFVWRHQDDHFQLVTWSKDQTLHLWPVSKELVQACGHRVEPESVVGVFDEDDVSMPASLESTPFASQSSATQTTPQALGLGVTGVSLMPISERGRNIDLMPFTDDEDDDQAGAGSIAGGMALGRTQTRADNCLELAIDSPLGRKSTKIREHQGMHYDARAYSSIYGRRETPEKHLAEPATATADRRRSLQRIPATLEEEIEQIRQLYPAVGIEMNTSDERSYSMSLQCTSDVFRTSPGPASVFLRIDVHFPPGYPGQGAVPNFEIQKSGMVSMSNRAHLSQRLSQISMVHVSRKLPCLEDCVRYLLGESSLAAPHFGAHIPIDTPPPASLSGGSTGVSAESYQGREALAGLDIGGLAHPGEELSLSETSSSDAEGPFALGRFKPLTDRRFMQDGPGSKDSSNVPYPRLCGASFSMSGHLVFFRSSLPHPSTTKFKAQIFSMRSQYPVRQLQAFTSQPKTLAQYFQYRNFLQSRPPRPGVSASAGSSELLVPDTSGAQVRTRRSEKWLGDDITEEPPSIMSFYGRPRQPALTHTTGFFADPQRGPTQASGIGANTPVRFKRAVGQSLSDLAMASTGSASGSTEISTPHTASTITATHRPFRTPVNPTSLSSQSQMPYADGPNQLDAAGSPLSLEQEQLTPRTRTLRRRHSSESTHSNASESEFQSAYVRMPPVASVRTTSGASSAASFGNIGDPFGSVRPDGPGGFGQHASSYGGTLIGRPIDIAKPLASSQHAGSLESGTSMDGSPDLIGHVLPSRAAQASSASISIHRPAPQTQAATTVSPSLLSMVLPPWSDGRHMELAQRRLSLAVAPPPPDLLLDSPGRLDASAQAWSRGRSSSDTGGSRLRPSMAALERGLSSEGSDKSGHDLFASELANRRSRDIPPAEVASSQGSHFGRAAGVAATAAAMVSSQTSGASQGFGSPAHQNTIAAGTLLVASQPSSLVFILDMTHLLPVRRDLAERYTLTGDDPAHICRTNRKHAKAARRMDLVRIWRLAELILSRETSTHDGANKSARDADESGGPFSKMHWLHHPMGQSMVQSIFGYLAKMGDIQTLAMLVCVFSEPFVRSVDRGDTLIAPRRIDSTPMIRVPSSPMRHMPALPYRGLPRHPDGSPARSLSRSAYSGSDMPALAAAITAGSYPHEMAPSLTGGYPTTPGPPSPFGSMRMNMLIPRSGSMRAPYQGGMANPLPIGGTAISGASLGSMASGGVSSQASSVASMVASSAQSESMMRALIMGAGVSKTVGIPARRRESGSRLVRTASTGGAGPNAARLSDISSLSIPTMHLQHERQAQVAGSMPMVMSPVERTPSNPGQRSYLGLTQTGGTPANAWPHSSSRQGMAAQAPSGYMRVPILGPAPVGNQRGSMHAGSSSLAPHSASTHVSNTSGFSSEPSPGVVAASNNSSSTNIASNSVGGVSSSISSSSNALLLTNAMPPGTRFGVTMHRTSNDDYDEHDPADSAPIPTSPAQATSGSSSPVRMLEPPHTSSTDTHGPRLLDPAHYDLYNGYLQRYAELLYSWALLQQRADLLKFQSLKASRPGSAHLAATRLLRNGHPFVGRQCPICRTPLGAFSPVGHLITACTDPRIQAYRDTIGFSREFFVLLWQHAHEVAGLLPAPDVNSLDLSILVLGGTLCGGATLGNDWLAGFSQMGTVVAPPAGRVVHFLQRTMWSYSSSLWAYHRNAAGQ